MASKSLTFNIFGNDRSASKAIHGVAGAANGLNKTFAAVGSAIAAAFSVVAITRFGEAAVEEFANAEKAQTRLADAYSRFPALADENIQALRDLNTELQKKTRFDDDALASAQATLAQYGLTGKQIAKLTPLLADYAAKTGKDVTDAALDLGKAMLGQGRALKAIGVDFVDTGTVAGNYEEILASLTTQVGGFAEKEGKTAAGQLEILRNRFGEVQEKIGGALVPALMILADFIDSTVMPAVEDFSDWFAVDGKQALSDFASFIGMTAIPQLQGFIGWIVQWKDLLAPAAVAVGVLTAAQWLLNVAMDANPVGAAILALEILIGLAVLVVTHIDDIAKAFQILALTTYIAGENVKKSIATMFEGFINGLIDGVNTLIDALNRLAGIKIGNIGHVNFGGSNPALSAVKGQLSALTGGTGGNKSNTHASMAEGGVVTARAGGIMANIGEGKHDEAVIPLTDSVLSRMGGNGGDTYVITVTGYVGDNDGLVQAFAKRVADAKRRGAIPSSAF